MTTFYTLSNGTQLSAFYWDDFVDNETYRRNIEVQRIQRKGFSVKHYGKEKKYPIQKDDRGIYFVYQDEKVYINDYDFFSAKELCQRIQEMKAVGDFYSYLDDDLWATLTRSSENLGFVIDLPIYEVKTPFGFALTGDRSVNVLCVPYEEGNYPRDRWHYKVEFHAENENVRQLVAKRAFYLMDLVSHIKEGYVDVVEIDDFKENKIVEVAKQIAKDVEDSKRFSNKVKGLFGIHEKKDGEEVLQKSFDYLLYGNLVGA